MAFKIEAHIVDEGTDEVRMSAIFWGDNKAEAEDAYQEAMESWPDFAEAEDDNRVIIEESECEDDERPVVEGEEEEDDELNPKKPE
jgi:hypothetical protein